MIQRNPFSLCTKVHRKASIIQNTLQLTRLFSRIQISLKSESNRESCCNNSSRYPAFSKQNQRNLVRFDRLNKLNFSLWSQQIDRRNMKDIQLANGSQTEVISNIKNGISTESRSNSIRSMAKLIDGKAVAGEIRGELRDQITDWIRNGHRAPHLTAVLVGDDPASHTYVRNKVKAAADVGITTETKRFTSSITESELLDIIADLNNDDAVDGILVQLPVPKHINERVICDSISCNKDVDGFNEKNVGRLCLDMNTLIPCTALGVQELLKRTNIETFGKNAVVIGRSKNVGLPIFMLLHADGRNDTCAMDATVTMCHRFTPPEQLKEFCLSADIIVSATGVPRLVTADMVKPGACIIDVGITRVTDEKTGQMKLVGDVDFDEVIKVAGHITPVPGGVGPMTVTMLMKNTFIAAKNLVRLRQVENK